MLKFIVFFTFLFSSCYGHIFNKNLSVCCIFQDDAEYLKEWIDFHVKQGFEHFYLYNNLSSDNYKKVLRPYIIKKIVTLIEWNYQSSNIQEWNHIQCSAYEHCIKKFKKDSKWIAFIDTDEFIFSPKKQDIKSLITEFSSFGGISINCIVYGTSGINKVHANEKITEKLTLHAQMQSSVNRHFKVILQPMLAIGCINPHYFYYKVPYFSVTENKDKSDGPFSKYVSVDLLRINHYWARDKDFFFNNKIKRQEKWGINSNNSIENEKTYNLEFDDIIIRL